MLENHLLSLLPPDELEAIRPHLEPVTLDIRQIVYDLNRPIEHAYFPEDCVLSIIGVMSDGSAIEVATVGNEGTVGLPLFLGAERVLGQAFCQVAGRATRMPAEAFKRVSRDGKFRDLLQLYTQALFTQISQAAACNRLHLTEERFARWLLMTHDRVGRDQFALTQEFLSQMLGVRRATISEIASQAQRSNLIQYSRGQMMIVNREGLEAMTCECYSIIRSEYEQLLGKPKALRHQRSRPPLPELSEAGLSLAGDGTPRDEREAAARVG